MPFPLIESEEQKTWTILISCITPGVLFSPPFGGETFFWTFFPPHSGGVWGGNLGVFPPHSETPWGGNLIYFPPIRGGNVTDFAPQAKIFGLFPPHYGGEQQKTSYFPKIFRLRRANEPHTDRCGRARRRRRKKWFLGVILQNFPSFFQVCSPPFWRGLGGNFLFPPPILKGSGGETENRFPPSNGGEKRTPAPTDLAGVRGSSNFVTP